MCRKIMFLGIFIVVVSGLTMTSCDLFSDNATSLIGTWSLGTETVTFNDDNTFTFFISTRGTANGTYTSTNSYIRFTLTDSNGFESWPWFDGRDISYEIKKWESGSNQGKYYLNIYGLNSDNGLMSWGKGLTKQK